MWKQLLSVLILFFIVGKCFADSNDQASAVSMQIDLLKNRYVQTNNELQNLQHQLKLRDTQLTPERVNKQMLEQTESDIAIAQSNVDSSDIELSEAQQSIGRIEKHIQDIENQLNILNIFGLKVSHSGAANVENLQTELKDQNDLLALEKQRADYLQKIKDTSTAALDAHESESRHVEFLLKSQNMMKLKEEQAQSEMGFERQQTYWLQQLDDLI